MMFKKQVSKKDYNQAIQIFKQVESTIHSDISWELKYDFIFSQDIDWLKQNIGLSNIKIKTSCQDDVLMFFSNFSQAMENLESIDSYQEIAPKVLYNS